MVSSAHVRVVATVAAVCGLVVFAAPAAAGVPPAGPGVTKVSICHATASFTNPYTFPSVDLDAVDGIGNNDHSHHTGHVFDGATKGWGDIIPPFADDGETPIPGGGLNWTDAGQAIHENGCVVPEPQDPLEADLAATSATCTAESAGGVLVTVANTGAAGDDVSITEAGGFDSGLQPVAAGESVDVLVPIAEDAAYAITVVDGATDEVDGSPVVGTLDCSQVLDTEEENDPATTSSTATTEASTTTVSTAATTAATVLGVRETNDQLPRTGSNAETFLVGLALILAGAVWVGLGQHLSLRHPTVPSDQELPGDLRLRRGDRDPS